MLADLPLDELRRYVPDVAEPADFDEFWAGQLDAARAQPGGPVFTSPSHFTLPLGVATFQTQYSQDTARIFAFTALSMVPALGFFVLAERRIVAGLTGSLKG